MRPTRRGVTSSQATVASNRVTVASPALPPDPACAANIGITDNGRQNPIDEPTMDTKRNRRARETSLLGADSTIMSGALAEAARMSVPMARTLRANRITSKVQFHGCGVGRFGSGAVDHH